MNAQLHPKKYPELHTLLGALLLFLPVIGCGKKEAVAPEIDAKVAVQFSPNPPVVGENEIEIALTDTAGKPLQFGMVKVEGNMNHAGMKPVFAELIENDPGKYAGTIEFTMGGDWFLLVTSEDSPQGRFSKKIDVPGVKAK
jgi:hypothetical protein